MHSFQFVPNLLIIFSLQFDILDKFAKISLAEFSQCVEEIWWFEVVVVDEFHFLFYGCDGLVDFLGSLGVLFLLLHSEKL